MEEVNVVLLKESKKEILPFVGGQAGYPEVGMEFRTPEGQPALLMKAISSFFDSILPAVDAVIKMYPMNYEVPEWRATDRRYWDDETFPLCEGKWRLAGEDESDILGGTR